MAGFLETLREKPEPVRKRILYVAVPLLTLLIVLFWLFSLRSGQVTAVESAQVERVGPASLVKADGATFWSGLKASISGAFRDTYTSH